MLAELVIAASLVSAGQDAPRAPDPATEREASEVADVEIITRPDTMLCVEGERPNGSRIQAAGVCRTVAAWRAIMVARADNAVLIFSGKENYVGDSALEEEAISRAWQNRLEREQRR